MTNIERHTHKHTGWKHYHLAIAGDKHSIACTEIQSASSVCAITFMCKTLNSTWCVWRISLYSFPIVYDRIQLAIISSKTDSIHHCQGHNITRWCSNEAIRWINGGKHDNCHRWLEWRHNLHFWSLKRPNTFTYSSNKSRARCCMGKWYISVGNTALKHVE